MANVTCELVWIRDLLSELDLTTECPIRLYYDNHVVIHIAENLVFFMSTQNTRLSCATPEDRKKRLLTLNMFHPIIKW